MSPDLLPPLQHPVARVLLACFVVLHVVLALASTGPTGVTIAALALLCAAATAVVLPNHLPRAVLAGAVAAPLLGTGLVLTTLHVQGWPGYAAWPLGATTFIALALAVRGQRGVAWLLVAGLAVESVTWSLQEGAGPLPGVDLVVRHAGTLLLGTLFAAGLRRAAATVASLHEAERRRRAEEAASAAADVERDRSVTHLLNLAGPALQSLADSSRIDPGDLRALEGRLRDEMTAAELLTDLLSDALADARRRGVDVVLLHDQHGIDLASSSREAAATWLAARAARARTGRFTARATMHGGTMRVSVQSDAGFEVLELPR